MMVFPKNQPNKVAFASYLICIVGFLVLVKYAVISTQLDSFENPLVPFSSLITFVALGFLVN